MRKSVLLILCSLCASLFSFVPTEKALKNAQNVDVFISFQRSGQQWTLLGLQYLTQRAWVHFEDYPATSNNHVWQNLLKGGIDPQKRPIYQSHRFEHVKYLNRHGDNRVFMIMRNYREVLLRHLKQNPQGEIDSAQMLIQLPDIAKRYAQILTAFDAYPDDSKCLVRYEDLMTEPRDVFENLLYFLDEPTERLDQFMDQYKELSAYVLKAYNKGHAPDGGSVSKGRSLTYHQGQVSKSMIRLLDMVMKQAVGRDIWEKYLEQYCTS